MELYNLLDFYIIIADNNEEQVLIWLTGITIYSFISTSYIHIKVKGYKYYKWNDTYIKQGNNLKHNNY